MSLSDPKNEHEVFIQKIRLHMEMLFGQELISSFCKDMLVLGDQTDTEKRKQYKVDSIRFQPYSLIPIPDEECFKIDLFIHPETNTPYISVFGHNSAFLPLVDIPIEQMEATFASILKGAQITEKGVKLPTDLRPPQIH
jgi:hypothetical protein